MTIAIPWCRKENYSAFRAIFQDCSYPPSTWEEFVRCAEEAEKRYEEQGGEAVARVEIDPQKLADWCNEKSRSVNARTCYDFAWQSINPGTEILD